MGRMNMNLRSSHRIGIAIIVILLFQFKAGALRSDWLAPDRQKSYKLVSHETHERVLDIVFQRDEANRDYDFVLRFEPSFAPESQITVKKAVGKIEVVTYRSL